VTPDWRGSPSFYGPAAVMLFGAIARLVRTPVAMIWVFKVVAGTASVATMLLVARLARRYRPERAAFAAGMIGLNPVVLFYTVSSGHIDPAIALAVVAALGLLMSAKHADERVWPELLATGLLALAAEIKSPLVVLLGVAIVWSVFRRPSARRTPILGGHLAVAVGVIALFSVPFMQARDPSLGMVTLSRYSSFLAPSAFVLRLISSLELSGGVLTWTVRSVRTLFPLTFLGAYVLILRDVTHRAAHAPLESQGTAWAWTAFLLILCLPILFPWYAMWLLPLAWLLPPRAALVACLASFALVLGVPIVAEVPAYASILRNLILIGGVTIAPALLIGLAWLLVDFRSRRKAGVWLDEDLGRENTSPAASVLTPVGG
jgi:4-amino-4-deoxy-L-arabinose transferase-like glycosyltransferase